MLSALMPEGQARRHLGQRLLDLLGQPHRIDGGLFLDGKNDSWLAHIAGFAARRPGREADLRHLPQVNGPACIGRHDQPRQIFELERLADVADQKLA